MDANFGKKIGKGVVIATAMVFLLSSFAAASPWGDHGRGEGFGKEGGRKSLCGIWRNPKIVEELGLTDEQVAKLKDVDFAHREKQQALKSQLDSLRLRMEKAFFEVPVDEAVVRELAGEISDLKGKLFTQGIKTRLEVGKLLSVDQLEKMKSLKARFPSRHGETRGKGKCRGARHDSAAVN